MSRKQLLQASVLFQGFWLVLAAVLGGLFDVRWWSRPMSVVGCLLGTALGIGLGFCVIAVAHLRLGVLARLQENFRGVVGALAPLNRGSDLVVLSLLAGLTEEAFVRGLLLDWLSQGLGVPLSLGLTSLLFGVMHPLSLAYVVYASLLGLVFGGLVLLTGELVPAMLAHAAFDMVAMLCAVRSRFLAAPPSAMCVAFASRWHRCVGCARSIMR